MSSDFAPKTKLVPVIRAIDKKPAGERLYKGVIGMENKNRKVKAHDIFNMPTSLGGQPRLKSRSSARPPLH
jgi:hypothetical protein